MKRYTVTCQGAAERSFDGEEMARQYAQCRTLQSPDKEFSITDNYKPEIF